MHRPKIVGIAGSVGKTSTKYALAHILKAEGRAVTTSGNSETGVPLGILGIQLHGYGVLDWLIALIRCPLGIFNMLGVKYLIVEMGIDDPFPPKNMEYLLTIVKPDISVFVAESAAHTMQFEKILTDEEKTLPMRERRDLLIRRITEEDCRMITAQTSVVVYNADNDFLADEIERKRRTDITYLPFGSDARHALYYSGFEPSLDGSDFRFNISEEEIRAGVKGFALPEEYREVFGAAILAAHGAEVPISRIQKALDEPLDMPKGRATLLKGINHSIIIDSSYNASKASVMAYVSLLERLKKLTRRPVVIVFGDMRELGGEAEIEHAEVAARCIEAADYLYCVGALTKQFIMPAANRAGLQDAKWFENSRLLGSYLRSNMPEKAVVLVKGSQNEIFLEEAIKFVLADEKDASRLCRQEKYWKKE